MIQSTESVPKFDRLSAIFDAFALSVRRCDAGTAAPADCARLYLCERAGALAELVLVVRGAATPPLPWTAVEVDFGGSANPLLHTLPERVALPLDGGPPALQHAALAFCEELAGARCGHRQALQRLGEVIVLLMLRAAIEGGSARPCLLAGLAHPQLHPALVAMHEAPGRHWNVDALAETAGMSRSRFMALFPAVVGTTPMAYLTRWRLQLGRRELQRAGARVKAVARRVGFASAEAFSRAYLREFGRPPVAELRS